MFTFLFLATAPIGLMPSIISLLTRSNNRGIIVGANIVLWMAAFFYVRPLFSSEQSGSLLPVVVGVVLWLGLFAFVIRSVSGRAPGSPT